MARPKRRRVRRPNKKFYLFLAVCAAAVFGVVFLINYTRTVETVWGKISFETQQACVLVRDEQVISAENYGKVSFIATEGEYVTADAQVAQIYKKGYNDKVLSDLLEVQTKIGQYQENNILGDVLDQDLLAINTSIEQKAEEIAAAVNGKTDVNLIGLEKDLNRLMADKQEYLKNKVNADTQLQDYYAQEAQLKERVESWQEILTAPTAGVVSFYFDGCEALLNAENIEQLTIKDINDILNGSTLTQITADSAETPLYRLVNSYDWYLLIVSKNAIDEFDMGQTFQIAFDEYLDKQYTGSVVGVREEDAGFVYAIEIQDDIGTLLNTRRTTAKIYSVFEGVKVPASAVKTVEGMTGVYVVDGYEKTFVPVRVLIEQDGMAIIEAADDSVKIAAGMEIKA